jgi:hypothetical protein
MIKDKEKDISILKDNTVIFTNVIYKDCKNLNGIAFKTIIGICNYIEEIDNSLFLTPSKKKELAKDLAISVVSIEDSIRKLCKLHILKKIVNNYYLVNPLYICKGGENNKENFITIHKKLTDA